MKAKNFLYETNHIKSLSSCQANKKRSQNPSCSVISFYSLIAINQKQASQKLNILQPLAQLIQERRLTDALDLLESRGFSSDIAIFFLNLATQMTGVAQ